jgi:hypothetical protein
MWSTCFLVFRECIRCRRPQMNRAAGQIMATKTYDMKSTLRIRQH